MIRNKKNWLIFLGMFLVLVGMGGWWWKFRDDGVKEKLAGEAIDVTRENEGKALKIEQWISLTDSEIKFPVPEGWFLDGTGRQIYENPNDVNSCKLEFDDFEWKGDLKSLENEVKRSAETLEDVSDLREGELISGEQAGYFQDMTLPIGSSRTFYTLKNGKGVSVTVYYDEKSGEGCVESWEEILKQIKWE